MDETNERPRCIAAGWTPPDEEARVRRLIDRLNTYERYWLFPGPVRLRAQLDDMG